MAASLVESTGRVLGIDRSVACVERAAKAALPNVSFEAVDDLASFRPRAPLDAVVGRLILMYLREPASVLSHFVPYVRPDVFQELVLSMCRSEPSCPRAEKCSGWWGAKADPLPEFQSKALISRSLFCYAAPFWESSMLCLTCKAELSSISPAWLVWREAIPHTHTPLRNSFWWG